MITTEQIKAADNAASGTVIQLRYIGVQAGFAHLLPQPLFNVVAGDYMLGSTITLKTALATGSRVEVVE